MFKLPKKIIEDTQKYGETLEKFLRGELKDAFFRGIRVPWGNYSQRGDAFLMSRLRVPAGILTPQQLKAIGTAADRFADGKLHITTRQDIQIHDVSYENSIKIIEYLKEFDISPRGGGGNTVRNITACYLSGICPQENHEVYKIVWSLSEYLLSLDEAYTLPRKLKIAFSGCAQDCAGSGVNDMGIVALKDGSFKVLCGGGMGAKSAVGKVLKENVQEEEIGYVVKALVNLFNKHGDRKNKYHNRLRFLIKDMGWENFVKLYNQELERTRENEHIVLKEKDSLPSLPSLPEFREEENLHKDDAEYRLFLKYNTGKQKQQGYRYIKLKIPFGEIDAGTLIALSRIGESLPRVNFRTTQRQNLIIANVPEDKIYTVYREVNSCLKDYLFPETILDIVCCKAATTCNLGICNAIALAPEIVNELNRRSIDIEKLKDIRININGCPNACGHHPTGTIALSGLARKVYNRTVPFYRIYIGGKLAGEKTKLAQHIGVVPARVTPKLIGEFIAILQENTEDGNVYQFIAAQGKRIMRDLVKKYSFVPPYEEDRSYYVDFGRTEDFSLEGLTQGECGAGVIDMIESDLESANQSLIKAREKDFALQEIRDALIYSVRALLVVKGVDPRDEQEAVAAFVDKFVKTGISLPQFENVAEVYADVVSGKIDRKKAYDYAERLYREVKEIYALMDSNFNFPVRFKAEETKQEEVPPQEKPMLYDLRGTPCPINYVKVKLRLEELKLGDILEVWVDEGEPIRNVPKSLQNDGQEILKIEPVENFFRVVVKKKVE